MRELGPEAREFLESHRTGRLLTDAARARMKQELMLRVSTVGATTAAAGTAAGMSLASKVILVALGVTGAVGTGALSVRALRSPSPAHVALAEKSVQPAKDIPSATPVAEPNPPTPMIQAAAPEPGRALRPMMPARVAAAYAKAPARRLATTPAGAAAPSSAGASRPGTMPEGAIGLTRSASVEAGRRDHLSKFDDRPVVSEPEKPTPAAPRVEAPDPEPELRVLRQARDDLRAGRFAGAYRRLEDFNRQNPGGMLAQERSALSAIALCQAQPGQEAQAHAAEFLRRLPESPLAARVKSACEPGQKDPR
jgi:hypothetical protein